MARLPQPGGDAGNWGQILNEYLAESHKADGTLKNNVVTSAQIAPDAVTVDTVGALGGTDGQVLAKSSASVNGLAWTTVSAGGTVPDASSGVKGIVQLSGDLGGTAATPTVPGLATKANTSDVYTQAQVNSALSAKLDASQKGANSGVASLDVSGKVPTAQLPVTTFPVTSVASKTGAVTLVKADVGLANVDNTTDASKPLSTAAQTAINAKYSFPGGGIPSTDLTAAVQTALTNANTAVKTVNGKSGTTVTLTAADVGAPTTLDALTDVSSTSATDGQSLVFNAGSWAPATVSSGNPGVNDASTTVKGIIQLAGDLGGTAAVPTVPGLTSKANTSDVYTQTQVNTALSAKLDASQKGANSGVASLDAGGKVPATQLPASAVTSVAGKTGVVTLVKGDVGLGNVDNTTDASKPISTVTQTALDAKAATNDARFTDQRIPSDNSVVATKIANDAVTEPKLAISNTPASSQVLSWDGSAMTWATPTASAPTFANIPAGSTLTVAKSGSTWPARPTARNDVIVQWKGPDPSPTIVASGTGGMLDNVDLRFITP